MENPMNRITAAGILTEEPVLSHEVMNEPFYAATLEVKRLSGAVDRIPLTLPGKLVPEGGFPLHTLLLSMLGNRTTLQNTTSTTVLTPSTVLMTFSSTNGGQSSLAATSLTP